MLTRRLGWASLLLLGVSLALSLVSRPSTAALSREKRKEIIPAVPLIVTVAEKDGKIIGIATSGSGTVISPKGHIMTNAHVVTFNHKLPEGIKIFPMRFIYLTLKNNEDPIPVCVFDPSHMPIDRTIDVAMVMCEKDLKGNPWDYDAYTWPSLPLGNPSEMVQGDDVWVFGYPGAGKDPRRKNVDLFTLPTMNVTAGKFSGVVHEEEGDKRVIWLKTDAMISGGNSGGCTTDDDGNYIGIPTEVHTDARGEAGTLGQVGFLRPVSLLGQFTDMIKANWRPDTATSGQDGAAGTGVTVSGGVVSAETGDPVANIVILVFKAGISAKQVLSSKSPQDLIMTRGVSDSTGTFTLMDKVAVGSYTVAVVGQGYKLVIEDNALTIDANTASSYRAWQRIPVTRCTSGPDCIL